jgi:Cytochrome P460
VAHEEGDFHSFAAVLGNNVAIKAYREGKLSFPDGTIIAALHYRHVASEENNEVFGRDHQQMKARDLVFTRYAP